ncbi:hypothetical protein BT96DRAFT_935704 [Gymnopus androsaceus JB14]|uniref:Uncharacterized protein n=1 Tax=Gymnopus androsaceus JB14 TaxID=1447944 RepID=A0A6A4I0R7_9AGAR|nr:hypothetical protein BT96DRAFT_935704 [Gymnopus androsaceus JB14]
MAPTAMPSLRDYVRIATCTWWHLIFFISVQHLATTIHIFYTVGYIWVHFVTFEAAILGSCLMNCSMVIVIESDTVLLTLRVYAIYGRDRRIIIVLSSLIFIGIGATAASLAFSKSTAITSPFPVGCHDVLDLRKVIVSSALVSVGWEALLIYDILLFSMTLLKAYQARSEPTITEMGGLSLFTIIVRDGSIYFGLMTLTNLVNVFTFYITGVCMLSFIQESLLRGTFSAFASCNEISSFSVTLMSRLMLHLHEIADKGLHVPYEDTLARPVHEHGSEPDPRWFRTAHTTSIIIARTKFYRQAL